MFIEITYQIQDAYEAHDWERLAGLSRDLAEIAAHLKELESQILSPSKKPPSAETDEGQ